MKSEAWRDKKMIQFDRGGLRVSYDMDVVVSSQLALALECHCHPPPYLFTLNGWRWQRSAQAIYYKQRCELFFFYVN